MLFYIGTSVVDAASAGDVSIIATLKMLLSSWQYGHCVLDSSRDNLNRIIAINDLKDFRSVMSRKMGINTLYEHLAFFVILSAGTNEQPFDKDGAHGRVMDILEISDLLQVVTNYLLCENINDAKLYATIAKDMAPTHASNPNVVVLNCECIMGGGKPIKDMAIDKHKQKRFCLTILDSDKHYETCNLGETATEYHQEVEPLNSKWLWSYYLSCREVENMIPHNIMVDMIPRCATYKMKFTNVDSDLELTRFFKYFDFKSGFLKSDLRNMIQLGDVEITKTLNRLNVKKKDIEQTKNSQYVKGEAPLLSGWGNDLLKNAVQKIDSHEVQQFTFSNYQCEDWCNIARYLWSIGCANCKIHS